jgi:hypothetical protein
MADKRKATPDTKIPSAGGAKISPKMLKDVDDILLSRIFGDDIGKYNQVLQSQQQGTNFAVDPSRYIAPNADIYPYHQQLNAAGFVLDAEPNTVYTGAFPDNTSKNEAFEGIKTLYPEMQPALQRILSKPQLGTVAHEMAHVGQHQNRITPQEAEKYGGVTRALQDDFMHATKLTDPPSGGFYNPFRGSGVAPAEMGAYLSQYEAIHPSAKNMQNQTVHVPLEKSYLGRHILPREGGVRALIDQIMGGEFQADPERLKYVKKLMGQERRK